MAMIEVERSEYESLIKDRANLEWLQEKITKVEEASANKTKALDEAKWLLKDSKKELKIELDKKAEELKVYTDKLWENDLDSLLENNTKYWEHLQTVETARTEKIDWMKELLWEEFIESKKDLFEWLWNDKLESVLTDYIDLKGLSKDNDWTPKVNLQAKWWEQPNKSTSDFETKLNSWANSWDLISSMAANM